MNRHWGHKETGVLWKESGIESILAELFDQLPSTRNKAPLLLYGDPAYKPSYGIDGAISATPGVGLSREDEARMSFYRAIALWSSGYIYRAQSVKKCIHHVHLSAQVRYVEDNRFRL